METDSGHEECPRCGLKNRLGTHQCDFCGWDFSAASDEWLDKVSALEQLGRGTISEMDQSTIGRIELTIKKPEEIQIRPPARPVEVAQDVDVAPAIEPVPMEDETLPEVADPPAEEVMTEEEIVPPEELSIPSEEQGDVEVGQDGVEASPAVDEALPEVASKEEPIDAPPTEHVEDLTSEAASEGVESHPGIDTQEMDIISVGLLATGAVIYIAALLVSPGMGKMVGWALAIIGALLITLAAGRWLARRRNGKNDDELFICSKCHEVISDADDRCPSCGAVFVKPVLKE